MTWLWGPTAGVKDYWVFHVSDRVSTESGQFVSFEDDPRAFGAGVEELADRALLEARAIRDRFSSVSALLDYYSSDAVRGWPGYHRAIALGVTGSGAAARELFVRVASEAADSEIEWIVQLGVRARSLAEFVLDEQQFRHVIEDQIREVRNVLHLRPLDHDALPRSNGD